MKSNVTNQCRVNHHHRDDDSFNRIKNNRRSSSFRDNNNSNNNKDDLIQNNNNKNNNNSNDSTASLHQDDDRTNKMIDVMIKKEDEDDDIIEVWDGEASFHNENSCNLPTFNEPEEDNIQVRETTTTTRIHDSSGLVTETTTTTTTTTTTETTVTTTKTVARRNEPNLDLNINRSPISNATAVQNSTVMDNDVVVGTNQLEESMNGSINGMDNNDVVLMDDQQKVVGTPKNQQQQNQQQQQQKIEKDDNDNNIQSNNSRRSPSRKRWTPLELYNNQLLEIQQNVMMTNEDNTKKKKKKKDNQNCETTLQAKWCDNKNNDKKEMHHTRNNKRQCVMNLQENSYKEIDDCGSGDSDDSSVITTASTTTIIATTRKENKATDDCSRSVITWEKMYESLVEYISQNRFNDIENMDNDSNNEKEVNCKKTVPWDGNVPQNFKTNDGICLGIWISRQRTAKRKGKLHPAREERLTNIGLKWKFCHTTNMDNTNNYFRNKVIMKEKVTPTIRLIDQKEKVNDDGDGDNNIVTNNGTSRSCEKRFIRQEDTNKRQCVLNRHKNSYKEIDEYNIITNNGTIRSCRKRCIRQEDTNEPSSIEEEYITTTQENKAPEYVICDLVKNFAWDSMYETLVEYINQRRCNDEENMMNSKKEGNRNKAIPPWIWDGNVPQSYKTNDGICLGTWISTQRTAKKKGLLHHEHEERLTRLGFRWRCRHRTKNMDTTNYSHCLQNQIQKNNNDYDANIITSNTTRRSCRKRCTRREGNNEHLIQEVEEHCQLIKRKSKNINYDENTRENKRCILINKKIHQNSNKTIKEFGRNDDTSFNVTTSQEDMAPKCVIKAIQNNTFWDDMYETLVEYINHRRLNDIRYLMNSTKEEGNIIRWIWDGNIPTKHITADGKRLGDWISNQRSSKRIGTLHPEHEERLTSLGFKWKCSRTNIDTTNWCPNEVTIDEQVVQKKGQEKQKRKIENNDDDYDNNIQQTTNNSRRGRPCKKKRCTSQEAKGLVDFPIRFEQQFGPPKPPMEEVAEQLYQRKQKEEKNRDEPLQTSDNTDKEYIYHTKPYVHIKPYYKNSREKSKSCAQFW